MPSFDTMSFPFPWMKLFVVSMLLGCIPMIRKGTVLPLVSLRVYDGTWHVLFSRLESARLSVLGE